VADRHGSSNSNRRARSKGMTRRRCDKICVKSIQAVAIYSAVSYRTEGDKVSTLMHLEHSCQSEKVEVIRL
jgi:hypothetical protein